MTSLCIKFPDKHIWGAAHPGARAIHSNLKNDVILWENIRCFTKEKYISYAFTVTYSSLIEKKIILASSNFAKKSFSTSEQTIRKYLVIIGSMLRNNTNVIFFWTDYNMLDFFLGVSYVGLNPKIQNAKQFCVNNWFHTSSLYQHSIS